MSLVNDICYAIHQNLTQSTSDQLKIHYKKTDKLK